MRHGFTDSQARVYLALLDHASMSAGALSKVTNVPRSHLYKVLSDLHSRGLVDIPAASGTREYRARPFEEFLKIRAAELNERLGEVASDLETLGPLMRPPEREAIPTGGEEAARVVLGRRAVAREIDDLLDAARNRVVIASTVGAAGRLARHVGASVESWRGRSVEATVVLPPLRSSEVEWERLLADKLVGIRWARTPPRSFVVSVDGERMILVHPNPDSDEQRIGKDFAVVIAEAAIVGTHVATLLAASLDEPPA